MSALAAIHSDWDMGAEIVQAVEPLVINGQDYLITDVGAVEHGRKTDLAILKLGENSLRSNV